MTTLHPSLHPDILPLMTETPTHTEFDQFLNDAMTWDTDTLDRFIRTTDAAIADGEALIAHQTRQLITARAVLATRPDAAHQRRIAALRNDIAERRRWIDQCGATLPGYVLTYGRSEDADRAGDGGEAIYAADIAALRNAEARLAALLAETCSDCGGNQYTSPPCKNVGPVE